MSQTHADTSDAPGSTGLSALFTAHRGELARFLSARCGDAAEADDLLQDLWLKLSALNTGPIANGRAYLFRMANNMVLDARRGRMRSMARDRQWAYGDGEPVTSAEDRPDTAEPADERMAREQEADILREAIASLPAGAQRALQLYRFEGLGQGEVAQAMGISRSGVEKHLAVAMKHLRAALLDCGLFGTVASSAQGAGRNGQTPLDERR